MLLCLFKFINCLLCTYLFYSFVIEINRMSSHCWYSKQDVIEDLAEVTGKCVDDFGEYYVVGANPPPVRRIEEDNDVSIFYGGQDPAQTDNVEKPDLAGISQMLRMVDKYNERSTEEDIQDKMEPNNVVSISKLNPNKFAQTTEEQNNISLKTDNNLVPKLNKDCCDTNVRNDISDNRVDVSSLLSDELKEMREKLKTKIIETSNVNCVKKKRERNLAIATLMKLYCKQTPKDKKPNLISPEYFINNSANNEASHIKENKIIKNNTEDNCTESILNASDTEIINKEIAASVEKVTKWLHSPETDFIYVQSRNSIKENRNIINEKKPNKGMFVHLGPVTFKRKTVNTSPMSPVSLQSDNSKTTKSESYVPSDYASELAKKYLQQSKVKQAIPDVWQNIEHQLKEKDEAIKKQRLLQ